MVLLSTNNLLFNIITVYVLQANNITVDTVNGVNLPSVADISFPGPVLVTGGKKFMGGLSVQGGLNVSGTINGVTISQFATQSSKALDEVHFDNLTLSRQARFLQGLLVNIVYKNNYYYSMWERIIIKLKMWETQNSFIV